MSGSFKPPRHRLVPAVYRAVRPVPKEPPRDAQVNATPSRISLVLPLPPSKNSLTKRVGVKGGGYREVWTEARTEFLRTVGYLGLGFKPFECPVSVEIRVFRARASGDLQNFEELLFDALEGVGYVDDKQVHHIESWLCDDPKNPRVEVSIEPIE